MKNDYSDIETRPSFPEPKNYTEWANIKLDLASLSSAVFKAVLVFARNLRREYRHAAIVVINGRFDFENAVHHSGPIAIDLDDGIEVLIGYDLTAAELVERGWTMLDAEVIAERIYQGVLEDLKDYGNIA